jgi:hypothetical protein
MRVGAGIEDRQTRRRLSRSDLALDQLFGLAHAQGEKMGRPSLPRATAHRVADGVRATIGGGVPMPRGEAIL